jgi:Domain of unknown function (DUF4105)
MEMEMAATEPQGQSNRARSARRLWLWLARWLFFAVWTLVLVWVGGVLIFGPIWHGWRLGLIVLGAATVAFVFWRWGFRRASSLAATGIAWSTAAICLWTLVPSDDRQWVVEQSRVPEIQIDHGSPKVTIESFRDFRYSNSVPTQESFGRFEFELPQIRRAWFVVQYFIEAEFIAHTMLCFEVHPEMESTRSDERSRFFAVSVEVRCEQNEQFGVMTGIYRNYELIYVVGDERDLLGKRIVDRPGDRVYLYQINAEPVQLQEFFCKIARRIDELKRRPEFYHTVFNNCTNNIAFHANQLRRNPLDTGSLRMVFSGFSDRLAFENQLIGRPGETFEDLKSRSRVDIQGERLPLDESFSLNLRRILDQQAK